MTEEVIIGNARLIHVSGEAHHGWLGDSVSEKGGRTRALRAYPNIGPCGCCGATKAERHHKDGNTANNASTNIEPLCRRCHMSTDGRLLAFVALAVLNTTKAVAAAAAQRRAQSHCKHGHALAGENVRLTSGRRHCLACERMARAKRRVDIACERISRPQAQGQMFAADPAPEPVQEALI